jgi:uncharacterized protein
VPVPTLKASWLALTFLHWPVDPAQVQGRLPAGLTADEYDGAAWIGLTPFIMAAMRPLGLPLLPQPNRLHPRLPDLSSSPETNLRTYVRGPDGGDGVWFLSMDIGNPVLALTLRGLLGAPYSFGLLTVAPGPETVRYAGSRVLGREHYRFAVRPGDPIRLSPLDVWLTGRWRLYSRHLGRLLATPVEHEPWPLQTAECTDLEQNLTDCAGVTVSGPPLVHYAERVDGVRAGTPRIVG